MYQIGLELAASNFDYFAGGGFVKPTQSSPTVYEALTANGYTYIDTKAGFEALTAASGKVVAVNPILDASKALPYELDRKNNVEANISLAEFTRKGIDMVYDASNQYGFFMMVEGGKIDWANHANDAKAAFEDTIAFDDAVSEAVAFYNQHPTDTLIIVTSDHDCGGMSLGWAGTAYNNRFDLLDGQTMSYEAFDAQVAVYRNSQMVEGVYAGPADIDDTMKTMILAAFGMNIDGIAASQKQRIEDAFDLTMAGQKGDSLLYGGYNPLSVTLTHILNNNAGIAYTSYAHTAIPVPVMAIGRDSYIFEGYYDNTDIAKKLASIIRIKLAN
jgi:alkaline phosphatase